MNQKNPIIVSLDGLDKDSAINIAKELSGRVWGFKVEDLLVECGIGIISELKRFGGVFADPKLYTIPNSVANSVKRLEKAGADFITVHGSGGIEMIKTAVNASSQSKILVVTVITSFDETTCRFIFGKSIKKTVIQFVNNALLAGAYGVVCSSRELKTINKYPEFQTLIKVTPGIRPAWYKLDDDQERTMSPSNAMRLGANFLVIGRPILKYGNISEAIDRILREVIFYG